ncbi:MAG: hypothetical protein IPJ10_02560 [Flavobacteriales bacterium]|nr:hypothetical protein [Flavobacteriales bacterium]
MQRLLPLAVRIQLLAQGTDLLLLRRGARGEGEGLEAAGIIVSRVIAHTELPTSSHRPHIVNVARENPEISIIERNELTFDQGRI